MSRELLGCPFCGTAPERDKGWGGYMKCGNIQCVLGGPDDEALWISESAWNTRAPMSVTNDPRVVDLVAGINKVIEMNRQHAEDQYGDADKAELWSCVVVLRAALAIAALRTTMQRAADRAEAGQMVIMDPAKWAAALEKAWAEDSAPASGEGQQGDVHPDDLAVDRFAAAMKEKLAAARAKGRGGWEDREDCSQQRLSDMLRAHVEKGDPRDVANFACFLWSRGESIVTAQQLAGQAVAPTLRQMFTGEAPYAYETIRQDRDDPDLAHSELWHAAPGHQIPEDATPLYLEPQTNDGYVLVPREPTEAQWGGLARDIVMWMQAYEHHTGANLFKHLERCGQKIPQWLRDEVPDTDVVPPKGTIAVIIYRAMIAASEASGREVGNG